MALSVQDLAQNVTFKMSRSGGKGGQNVNKVSTKVELNFDFESSPVFSNTEKDLLRGRLSNRMTSEGFIQIKCDEERSQYLNKERALFKLVSLLKSALAVQKARKATKPKKSAVERRLKSKELQSIKKLNRKALDF